ncbi:MAG: transcriptional regulator [Gemmatimonadota bacterium]|nr:transcriptional regulator [Gemmatimonadota bacterium]
MTPVPMTLVTIIAEHVLREPLTADLRRLGARGYSIGEVEGEGTRGLHTQDWQGKNLRIETVVPAEVAAAILAHLAARYFDDYAMIAYTSTVAVLRSGKFA